MVGKHRQHKAAGYNQDRGCQRGHDRRICGAAAKAFSRGAFALKIGRQRAEGFLGAPGSFAAADHVAHIIWEHAGASHGVRERAFAHAFAQRKKQPLVGRGSRAARQRGKALAERMAAPQQRTRIAAKISESRRAERVFVIFHLFEQPHPLPPFKIFASILL